MNIETAERLEKNIRRVEKQISMRAKIEKAIGEADMMSLQPIGLILQNQWYFHAQRLREFLT